MIEVNEALERMHAATQRQMAAEAETFLAIEHAQGLNGNEP